MTMRHPTPGLRPIWHNANSARKVELTMPANELLHVSDELAAQLQRADSHFTDVAADFVPPAPPEPITDGEPAALDEPEAAEKPKRSTRKKS